MLTTGAALTTSWENTGDEGDPETTCSGPPSTVTKLWTTCLAYCEDQLFTATFFSDVDFTETLTSTLTVPFGSAIPPIAEPVPTLSTPIAPCFFVPLAEPSGRPTIPATTVLLTSKLIVTSIFSEKPPNFSNPSNGPKTLIIPIPGGEGGMTLEQGPPSSVVPTPPASPQNPPTQPGAPPTAVPIINPTDRAPATITVGHVPVIIAPTAVIINSQTFGNGPGDVPTVTVGDQTFTINPSQVIGDGRTLVRPPLPTPASPTPTIVGGVPISVGPSSVAVIGGSTFTIGPASPQTSVVVDGQTVNVGPAGIAVGTSTFAPADLFPTPTPENILAVPTVEVIAGQTVTAGAADNGNPNVPQYQTLTASSLIITQVFISSSTYAIFSGQTFALGVDGLSTLSAGMTIPPDPSGAVVITAGGITLTEVGSTLAVINGTTYTIGPNATPTTAVIDGQTVSFGPNGIGFATTTVVPTSPSGSSSISISSGGGDSSSSVSATASPTKKGSAGRAWDRQHMAVSWTVCMGLGVWSFL